MFAPNSGRAYPWPNYANGYNIQPDDPDYPSTDTNKDGVLDEKDDPYLPYYPGDE
jgi:hypothetical protein